MPAATRDKKQAAIPNMTLAVVGGSCKRGIDEGTSLVVLTKGVTISWFWYLLAAGSSRTRPLVVVRPPIRPPTGDSEYSYIKRESKAGLRKTAPEASKTLAATPES